MNGINNILIVCSTIFACKQAVYLRTQIFAINYVMQTCVHVYLRMNDKNSLNSLIGERSDVYAYAVHQSNPPLLQRCQCITMDHKRHGAHAAALGYRDSQLPFPVVVFNSFLFLLRTKSFPVTDEFNWITVMPIISLCVLVRPTICSFPHW